MIKGQIRMVIKLKRKILLAHWTIKKCITVLNKQEETIANRCLRIYHIRNWVGCLWSLPVLYQVGARIFSLFLNCSKHTHYLMEKWCNPYGGSVNKSQEPHYKWKCRCLIRKGNDWFVLAGCTFYKMGRLISIKLAGFWRVWTSI